MRNILSVWSVIYFVMQFHHAVGHPYTLAIALTIFSLCIVICNACKCEYPPIIAQEMHLQVPLQVSLILNRCL